MRLFFSFVFFLSLLLQVYGQNLSNRVMMRMVKKDNYEKAIEYGNAKLAHYEKKGKSAKKANPYLLTIGFILSEQGDYKGAEEHLSKALTYAKEKLQKGKRAVYADLDVYDELALLYLKTGNLIDAENLMVEAIAKREQRFSKSNPIRYRSYLPYGMILFEQGKYDVAFHYLKNYLLYIKNSNHTSKLEINRYADTYGILAELKIALSDYESALDFAKKNNKYQHHLWTRKEAGKNYVDRINALNQVGECYRLLGDYDNALKFINRAFKLYDRAIGEDTHHQILLLKNQASLFHRTGKTQLAQEQLIKACELEWTHLDNNFRYLSEYEKENFYKDSKSTFDQLFQFTESQLIKNNIDNELLYNSLEYRLKTKAIILNESNKLLQSIYNSDNLEQKNKFEEWKHLKNELAHQTILFDHDHRVAKTEILQSKITEIEKYLAASSSLFQNHTDSNLLEQLSAKLKSNEALIEIVRTKSENDVGPSYLFFILKNGMKFPQIVRIEDGNYLEGKLYNYYKNTCSQRITDKKSYRYYWAPLKDKLQGIDRVYVSPDGIYNLINLSILKNTETDKYLMDELNVYNITNGKNLLQAQKQGSYENAVLLGRPQFPKNEQTDNSSSRSITFLRSGGFRNGISDLPGTEKEVKTIASSFKNKGINTTVKLGSEATESFLKSMKSPNILHIATHGFFDSENKHLHSMLGSGLLLAELSDTSKTLKEDGIINAYELSCLDLMNTHLATLSACETGLGEIKNGEGVYGLQRSLEVAGVNHIIMSMWQVDDTATEALMSNFYQLLVKDIPPYEAFKQAQLKLREDYPYIFYWGAFKFLGK